MTENVDEVGMYVESRYYKNFKIVGLGKRYYEGFSLEKQNKKKEKKCKKRSHNFSPG